MAQDKQQNKKPAFDIALSNGAGARFLSWMIALVIFLSSFSVSGYFLIDKVVNYWTMDVSGHITIEVSPPIHTDQETGLKKILPHLLDERITNVTQYLKQHEEVENAEKVTVTEIDDMIKEWENDGHDTSFIPLPTLIDVTLSSTRNIDTIVKNIKTDIQSKYPFSYVNDHKAWLADFIAFLHFWKIGLTSFALVMGIVAVLAVIAIIRSRMKIHTQEIELLHLIGASDTYIATQFQKHALISVIKGAVIGSIIALITLYFMIWKLQNLETHMLPDLNLSLFQNIILIFAPIAIGSILALITARKTALTELAKLS